MASPRFYAPELNVGEVELEGSEAHHLVNVRRLRPDDTCELFDGNGRSAQATVEVAKKRTCRLLVEVLDAPKPPAAIQLTIAAPLPRTERARWLIEKLTELDVSTYIPLITQHSQSTARSAKADKHRQYVIDACKQSGRNTLMTITEPATLTALLDSGPTGTLLAASQNGGNIGGSLEDHRTLIVGPEGGFSASELDQLQSANAIAVSFGPNILRLETAAIAGAVRFSN